MEEILARAGSQAVTLALRSGINIAGGYAIGTLSKFLLKVPEDDKANFNRLKERIQTKINIITPAIDLIELYTARGNTVLSQTLQMTRELKQDIEEFQTQIQRIEDEQTNVKQAMKEVEVYAKELISRIEEAIPMVTLSLTTSGANLSSGLPDSVSPGRLLQASQHLSMADAKFESMAKRKHSPKNLKVQVGPDFILTMYTLYRGAGKSVNFGEKIAWKEDYPKCRARLWRIAGTNYADNMANAIAGYDYRLTLEEMFDDDRYHDPEDVPRKRELDVSTITRLFFTASGRLLDIEESQSPVLVLKLNDLYGRQSTLDNLVNEKDIGPDVIDAEAYDEYEYDVYENLNENVEWVAFETFQNEEEEEKEEEEDDEGDKEEDDSDDSQLGQNVGRNNDPLSEELISALSSVSIQESQKSLSLLEYILRLSALQQNDQNSMLNTQDERIVLYLRDENHNSANARSANVNHSYQSAPGSNFSSPGLSNGQFSPYITPQKHISGFSPRYRVSSGNSSRRASSGVTSSKLSSTTEPEKLISRAKKKSSKSSAPTKTVTSRKSTEDVSMIRTPVSTRVRQDQGHSQARSTEQASEMDIGSNAGTPHLTPWERDKLHKSMLRNIVKQQNLGGSPLRGKDAK